MHDDVIAHIRERIATMRRIGGMAHDPRMIEMLETMVRQAEADIRKLEADSSETPKEPPAQRAGPDPTPQA
jgi:hypothetical protein